VAFFSNVSYIPIYFIQTSVRPHLVYYEGFNYSAGDPAQRLWRSVVAALQRENNATVPTSTSLTTARQSIPGPRLVSSLDGSSWDAGRTGTDKVKSEDDDISSPALIISGTVLCFHLLLKPLGAMATGNGGFPIWFEDISGGKYW